MIGTTWHTAGLVWRLRPNDTDIQLLNHMSHLVNNIEEETGINPGWINNGGLFIANNEVNTTQVNNIPRNQLILICNITHFYIFTEKYKI